jgi:hypothetical protein
MQRHTKLNWISISCAAQRVVTQLAEFLRSNEGRSFRDGGAGGAKRNSPVAATKALEDNTRATSPASRRKREAPSRGAAPPLSRQHREGITSCGTTPPEGGL